jgi:DNA-directed RNA polymerase specialized sigma24 family protein
LSKSSLQLKKAYSIQSKEEEINEHFDLFLKNLIEQKPLEWGLLDKILRKSTIPWLYKKLTRSTNYNHSMKEQLSQEIYANSLQTYIRLIPNGTFESISNLVSLMYSIADKKLKETYRAIQKNGRVVYTDNSEWMNSFEDPKWQNQVHLDRQQELITKMQSKLEELSNRDKEILLRFASGEKLKDIAISMDVPQATCRKQKERALQRLRKLFFDTVKLLVLLTWITS